MAQIVVARYAEHNGVMVGKVRFAIGKADGLDGAARRVVLRVEIEHDILLAPKAGKLDHFHACVGQFKNRSVSTNL
jgi:hypothetical protein